MELPSGNGWVGWFWHWDWPSWRVCEVVYIIEGWAPPTHRWNTIFKFHLQAWLCFSIGCGWLLANWWTPRAGARVPSLPDRGPDMPLCLGLSFAHSGLGTRRALPHGWLPIFSPQADGVEGRTRQIAGVKTVDGLNFLRGTRARCRRRGIDWLRANIDGVPVVAEAAGESYRA